MSLSGFLNEDYLNNFLYIKKKFYKDQELDNRSNSNSNSPVKVNN